MTDIQLECKPTWQWADRTRAVSLAGSFRVSAGNIRTSRRPSCASCEPASGRHYTPAAGPAAAGWTASAHRPLYCSIKTVIQLPFYGHYTVKPVLAVIPIKNKGLCWSEVLLPARPWRWQTSTKTSHLLVMPCFRSAITTVTRSRLLAHWPGTLSRILCRIQRAVQMVLGVYSKCTCSRLTSASNAIEVLNDDAQYKSTHALTHSPTGLRIA